MRIASQGSSLEERYGSHGGYVQAVTAAANALILFGAIIPSSLNLMLFAPGKARIKTQSDRTFRSCPLLIPGTGVPRLKRGVMGTRGSRQCHLQCA